MSEGGRAMETPESLKPHEPDYKPAAWRAYTLAELGWWVHLLATRAGHRADAAKRGKDLGDAQAYLDMMQARLNDLKKG